MKRQRRVNQICAKVKKHLPPLYVVLQCKHPQNKARPVPLEKKEMKKAFSNSHVCTLIFILFFIAACGGQTRSNSSENNLSEPDSLPKTGSQIDEYVVEIFEDKKGNLWFGTLNKGAARYDGKSLDYLSMNDGLTGNAVTCIVEDKDGNIWLGTQSGLSKYDGNTFANYTTKNGLCHDVVSDILIDKSGNIWVGTWGGVCRYDGAVFTRFPVPIPDIELLPYQNTMNWVTEIMQDRQGNIWFARDGYGACKYDGVSFTHFTKKEGLPSNNVQAIQEDKQGNIWFGCRVVENDYPDPEKRSGDGGLARYDGKKITQYPGLEGLSKNDVYTIYEDKAGNIWIGATRVGLYRYDGQSFQIYKGTDRMDLTWSFGVQSILEDKNGRLWLGFSGGLFRLKESAIVNITDDGQWK